MNRNRYRDTKIYLKWRQRLFYVTAIAWIWALWKVRVVGGFFFQTSLSHYGIHHKKPKHQLVKMSVFAEICVQSRFSRHYKIQNNISTRNVEYIAPHKLQWIINLLLNVYWFMIETWLKCITSVMTWNINLVVRLEYFIKIKHLCKLFTRNESYFHSFQIICYELSFSYK